MTDRTETTPILFFSNFIKDFDDYDDIEFVMQFNGATLTDEFLKHSGLPDEKYSSVSFILNDKEVVVYDRDESGEKVVYSSLIACGLN